MRVYSEKTTHEMTQEEAFMPELETKLKSWMSYRATVKGCDGAFICKVKKNGIVHEMLYGYRSVEGVIKVENLISQEIFLLQESEDGSKLNELFLEWDEREEDYLSSLVSSVKELAVTMSASSLSVLEKLHIEENCHSEVLATIPIEDVGLDVAVMLLSYVYVAYAIKTNNQEPAITETFRKEVIDGFCEDADKEIADKQLKFFGAAATKVLEEKEDVIKVSDIKNIVSKGENDMRFFWGDGQPRSKNLEKEYPENNQQPTAEMFRKAISKDHKKGKGENNMGFFCGGNNIRSKNLVEEYPEITKPVYKVAEKPADSRYVKASDFVERLSEELSEYKKANGCVAQIKELIDGCGGNFDTKDLIEFIISPDESNQSGVGYKPKVYRKIAEVAEEYGFEDIRIYEGSSDKNFVAIRQYD